MYTVIRAHIQNTTPQLTPNRNSCIDSNLLQCNFVSLAMLLIRNTLTVGAKVLSPLSFGCQSLIHISSSVYIHSIHQSQGIVKSFFAFSENNWPCVVYLSQSQNNNQIINSVI